jgi:hypothetical protein
VPRLSAVDLEPRAIRLANLSERKADTETARVLALGRAEHPRRRLAISWLLMPGRCLHRDERSSQIKPVTTRTSPPDRT